MIPGEHNQYIKSIRDRYEVLNLTFEQAEKVYKHEEEISFYSAKHVFSQWEESDYTCSIFATFLGEQQMKAYEDLSKQQITQYEQGLIKQDADYSHHLAYHEELINFYKRDVLPDLFKDPFIGFRLMQREQNKITFLRAEYSHFLAETKREVVTSHFRHNRRLRPNELKLALLRHKISYIIPDYASFKSEMDEPTKNVARYLADKTRILPAQTEALFTNKMKEVKQFVKTLYDKYYRDSGGWHVEFGQIGAEDEKENRSMTLLLLDEKRCDYSF